MITLRPKSHAYACLQIYGILLDEGHKGRRESGVAGASYESF